MFGLLTILFTFAVDDLNHSKVVLQPVDIVASGGLYPLGSVHQIESDGGRLFLRSLTETRVLVTDRHGKVLQEIGRAGNGPGEWGGTGIQAMAIFKGEIWGIGTHRLTLNGFKGGDFLNSIDGYGLQPGHQGATSNVFAVSPDLIVVPSPFRTDHLALAFSKDGQSMGQIGTPLIEEKDMVTSNPFANDTMWHYRAGKWFALFKFFPVVAVFDKDLKNQTFFNLEHPWVAETFAYISDDHGPNIALPLFSDFKMFRNHLYAMCRGRLLQINLVDMTVESVTSFIGRGTDFGPIAGKSVSLPNFSFLDDGTLYLAHPMQLWHHDLWQVPSAALPHLNQTRHLDPGATQTLKVP